MTTSQSIDVRAPATVLYLLAARLAEWPRFLPHYRYVTVLKESASARIAIMAARRNWIPVRWTAEQRLMPDIPRVEFTHIGGWTTGMKVAWTFAPLSLGTRVTISHDLSALERPLVASPIGQRLISIFFVEPIARRTLARMKAVAEAGHA